jgi:acyl dehydratase
MRVFQNIDELRSACGSELGVSDWFVVSQELVNAFGALTSDEQWIHLDVERAAADSPFGGTIAHGFLTLSLVSYLFRQTFRFDGERKMTVNYGFNRIRFVSPVRTGTRIRLRSSLQSLRDVDAAVECVWDLVMEREGSDKPALAAQWITRIVF